MPAVRVLLVEDDAATRRSVARHLVARGYEVDAVADGEAWRRSWQARRPDLVLLDLGLPDTDGITIVRLTRRDATTPILVISARDREGDRVEALELGADDYLTKPFGMRELEARITALLRRAGGPIADAAGRVSIGPLTIDVPRHVVQVHGRPLPLTPREFELLRVLVSHAGHLVTTGRLLRAVWGTGYDSEAHYVHVYVSQLRRKLSRADESGALRSLITTEPGVGYRVGLPEVPES